MKYVVLKNHCEAVFGNNGASIYNLKNGNYYLLDEKHAEILKEIKNGTPILKIRKKFKEFETDKFLNKLINSGLAKYSTNYFVEETFRVGNARPATNLDFSTCYIELPIDCLENCKHCYEPKMFSCVTCSKPSNTTEKLDLNFYKILLNELLQTPVKTIIFHGGDPLLNETKVLELLKFGREKSNEDVKIIVKTNGNLLNENQISTFIMYKINPLIVFNMVNSKKEDFTLKLDNLQSFLDLLSINNIDFFGNIVFNNPDIQYQKHFIDLLQKYNFTNITTSVVISKYENLRKYANINFSEKLAYNFSVYKDLHPCLNGILAITSNKKVVPCPSMQNHVLLDLNKSNLRLLFDDIESINEYWRLTLQQIDKCKLCKLRYSCVDCRAIEEELSKGLFEKKICYLGL